MKIPHRPRLLTLLAAVLLTALPLRAVDMVAHRGASFEAPENTLAATRLAWAQSADAVETDIYLTKDGKIVVLHDRSTKRTTGHDALIDQLTAAEACALDVGSWKGPQFAGEKLPLLEEQLGTIPPGRRMLVEIKVGPEIVPELARVLQRTGATADQVVIISFNDDALRAVRQQLPRYKTLWLVGYAEPGAPATAATKPPPTVDEMIAHTREAGFTGLDLQHTWPFDAATAKRITDAGLELHVWTVNDPAIARRWVDLGVASITTNRPAWLREQLQQ